MPGYGTRRDPVSELWDRAAPAILARVYERRGGWYATRIADPKTAHVVYFLNQWGIDVTGGDNAATLSGRHINYRTRWNRSFVRAVYFHNKRGPNRPLEVQVGRPKPAAPGLPAGWAVRLRIRPGGKRAMRAVQRKKEPDRIWVDDKEPGGRFSVLSGRDWV